VTTLERISITIEQDLLERFDALLADGGTASRSEGLRDLIRRRLSEEEVALPEAPAVGSITLVFDHHQRELSDRLTNLGHDHHDLVLASIHQHLDHHHCLEVLTLAGSAAALRSLARSLGGLKGVLHSELVLAAAPPHPPAR
jgi:CopG family nickel-responsive transcriptional regulator